MTETDRRPRTSVFVGMSVDGFIARVGGTLDFLDVVEPVDGDTSFVDFLASVDAMVMGRATFDFVMNAGVDWPYGDRPMLVMTRRPLELPDELAGLVEASDEPPDAMLARLAGKGATHVYVDGGLTVRAFLRAGLIDDLILTRVPVLVGSGISVFGELPGDRRLDLVRSTTFPNGMVQTHYRVR